MKTIQYTIRGVPPEVDTALREEAKKSGESLNSVVLKNLQRATGQSNGKPKRYTDLSHLRGTWVEDPAFDEVMEDMGRIDEEMWQ